MTKQLSDKLQDALHSKKINQVAFDEIIRWLNEDEFIEFRENLIYEIEQNQWESLLDKFYTTVVFGTGGIRGVMDIGTNRINNYTIRWATQAYARYLLNNKPELANHGVAIAYDSRNNSQQFMEQTASVLAGNGIPVYIFDYYRATPELSFTVRHLGLAGGIVVTASHNPPQFNGWKVYDEKGIQVLPEEALLIEAEFKAIESIKKFDFNSAVMEKRVKYIDDSVDKAFLDSATKVSIYPNREVKIVYSPLHGVGSQNVLPALEAVGFKDIVVVDEQMSLDGNFPTVKDNFPQPEFPVVYDQAITLAKEVKADIVLVSDPDADRLGIAVPDNKGTWHVLTGNQGGVVMGEFFLQMLKQQQRLKTGSVMMKTTVTTDLLRDIADDYGVEVVGDLLVGFKFIGDRIERLPKNKSFLFGLEESIGYLFTTAYRDKGAETPAIVAAEMAAWCKNQNKTVIEYLESIYRSYGFYAERLHYRLIEGLGALDQMNLAMKQLRQNLPAILAGRPVIKVLDRLNGELRDGQTGSLIEIRDWDKGDMLTFFFSQDERNALHVRPSGTEPKMKYYTMIKGSLSEFSKKELEQQAEEIEQAIVNEFQAILSRIEVDVFQ